MAQKVGGSIPLTHPFEIIFPVPVSFSCQIIVTFSTDDVVQSRREQGTIGVRYDFR